MPVSNLLFAFYEYSSESALPQNAHFNLKGTFQLQINHSASCIDVVPGEGSVCKNVIARVAEHQDALEDSGSEDCAKTFIPLDVGAVAGSSVSGRCNFTDRLRRNSIVTQKQHRTSSRSVR